jgi:hypothetical protein
LAPVAVSSALLGPGVAAAATEKAKKATACSGVSAIARHASDRLDAWLAC